MSSTRLRAMVPSTLTVSLGLLLCCVAGCKEVTEEIVGKTVQVAKDTAKGVEDGVDKGRKDGQSADGAIIVSKNDDLTGKGTFSVRAVRPLGDAGAEIEVELAIENTADRPLRITQLEVLALDREGFVRHPKAPPAGFTVPPKAKDKLVVAFDAGSNPLAKVRIWGKDYDMPSSR